MSCEEGKHQVQLIIFCKADDDIRLGDTFLRQEVYIRAVAADRKSRRQLFGEQFAALAALVNYFHLNSLSLKQERQRAPRSSRTDDGGTRQLVRVARYETVTELLNAFGQSDEVGIVPREKHIVTVRDNHAVVTEDESCEYPLGKTQLLERLACDGGAAANACLEKTHLALCEVLHVECGRGHENAIDFVRCDEFRVQYEVDVEVFLEIASCIHCKIHVANAGDRMLDTVLLREYTGDDIYLVALRYCDENVRALDIGVVHRERACDVRLDRQYVQRCLCRFELPLIAVHHDDIHVLLREQCRDAVTQPSSSCNYDPHDDSLLRFNR